MDPLLLGTLVVRIANAILWTAYVVRLVRSGQPLTTTVGRKVIGTVIVFGMWCLVVGGVEAPVARTLYTVFTAYAAIVALALLTEKQA